MDAPRCRDCGDELVVGDNWFKSWADTGVRQCNSCKAAYRRANEPNNSPSRGNVRRNGVDYCEHEECAVIRRATVLERGDFTCGICHDPIEDEWHMDHIIPVSKRGKHCYYNLQPSHPICNLLKGDTILVE